MLLLLGVLMQGFAVSLLPFIGTNPIELNPDLVQRTPFDRKPSTERQLKYVSTCTSATWHELDETSQP